MPMAIRPVPATRTHHNPGELVAGLASVYRTWTNPAAVLCSRRRYNLQSERTLASRSLVRRGLPEQPVPRAESRSA
jgi:hypothetical protein